MQRRETWQRTAPDTSRCLKFCVTFMEMKCLANGYWHVLNRFVKKWSIITVDTQLLAHVGNSRNTLLLLHVWQKSCVDCNYTFLYDMIWYGIWYDVIWDMIYMVSAVGTRCADHVTPLYPQKLALTSPTGGGRSVGIVRLWTKATEFSLVYGIYDMTWYDVIYGMVYDITWYDMIWRDLIWCDMIRYIC